MDQLQATPRRFPMVGGLADFLAAGTSPQRTQQMRGLMEFLQVPDIAKTLDRVSYGEPLTTGAGMTTKLRPEAENTLMAALGMTPVGKPAQAGAMALGRAGERVAERVVPQVMERGGLPAEMLSAMAQGTQSPATVFHGTPHLFNKFDSSKIGTGEGAQAYGHGLYLAENPAVAKEYSKLDPAGGAIPSPVRMIKGAQVQPGTGAYKAASLLDSMTLAQAKKTAKGWAETSRPEETAYFSEVLDTLNSIGGKRDVKISNKKPPGYLMQVDLPDEQIAKMLDYDKPLSEQPKIVQDFLLKNPDVLDYIAKAENQRVKLNEMSPMRLEKLKSASIPFDASRMTGKDAMTAIAQRSGLGKAAEAENMLRQAGIPGIRYLDEGSRGAGKGTSNFVVFPGMEDMLRIEQINNQPVESLFRSLGR